MTEERNRAPLHDEAEYLAYFRTKDLRKALEVALDSRKLEINLYWQRATYFWTLIGVAFVGFGITQQIQDVKSRFDLIFVVACLGIVFSFAWFCINQGSKYWQRNWEKHVGMLEDEVIGPLFKTKWRTEKKSENVKTKIKYALIEGSRMSFSKINQLVSFFVFVLWVVLLIYEIYLDQKSGFKVFHAIVVLITVLACISIAIWGKSGHERPLERFKFSEAHKTLPPLPEMESKRPFQRPRIRRHSPSKFKCF